MTDVKKVLEERGNRYGDFEEVAKISQFLKDSMRLSRNWDDLRPDTIESLDMIQFKIARVLCGDPEYDDNWIDIQGYAKLISDRISNEI